MYLHVHVKWTDQNLISFAYITGASIFAVINFRLYSLSLLSLFKMTHKGWRVIKPQHNNMFCKLSLSLECSSFFTLMQIWYFLSRYNLLPLTLLKRMLSHWRELNERPAYLWRLHYLFVVVIRFSHCLKTGSYKFLAEVCSLYWLTAYV